MAKISIFGFAGTGKTTAGKLLAEKLGYNYVSTGNMFRAKASVLGITLQELEQKSELDESFDRELDKETEDFGKNNNNFVIESRLAWHFVPDSFKIMFDCDFDVRIFRISDREHKDFEQVKMETLEREESIKERYKRYYGINCVDDKENFDLIIDTTNITPETIVEIMMNSIKANKL